MSRDSYHEYFDGYMELSEVDKKGRERLKRVYIADYYQSVLSEDGWKRMKMLCTGLWMGDIMIYIFASVQNQPCNTADFVDIAQMLCFLPLLLWSFTACEYLVSPRKLTIGKFRSIHEPFIRRAYASAVFEGILAATVLANVAARADLRTTGSLGILFLYAAGALMAAWIGRQEQGQKYNLVENDIQPPENGILIRDSK